MASGTNPTGVNLKFIEAADASKVAVNKGNLIIQDDGKAFYDNSTGVRKALTGSGSESSTASWVSASLNTATTGVAGLCKFSLTGLASPCQHNPVHGNVKNKYVPIQHTIGTLKLLRGSTEVTSLSVDLFGRDANATYGFTSAKDEISELGLKRVWSDDFYITSSYSVTTTTPSSNSANRIHTFTIPASAFGDQPPKKSGVIEPLCSFGYPRTVSFINSYTDTVTNTYSTGYYVAMEYDSSNDVYKVVFLTNAITAAQLLATKLFIRYELDTPVYDRHTNKLYVEPGDKFTFTQESVESFSTNKSTPSMNTVTLTYNFSIPNNAAAVREGFEQVSVNLNDLNNRVDNIDVSNRKIGYADGVSDDSDNIQNLINNAENASGHISDVFIPDGVYALSKSITITKSNIRLIGNGNVILKPTGNFPAIMVYRPESSYVEDVYIENIKIYLPNTAYLDGSFEGSHSGIYINGSYSAQRGLYRINVKDVSVYGAYRYDWQNIDKSYAIYCKDNDLTESFAYFCNFENIDAMSVYCGIYLGNRVNGTRIHNYHWDRADVNGYNGLIVATMGVAYGIICKSSNNDIDFRGQSFGDNEGEWCYKDYDKNIYALADVIGSSNVKTVNGYAYFADSYTPNLHETITSNGKTIDVFLGHNNLTKVGIYCSGSFNKFSGHIYDPQRSDYQYEFTSTSSYNRYYYPTAFYLCGTTHSYNTFTCDLHGTGSYTDTVAYEVDILKDSGYENLCLDYVEAQPETFVSGEYTKSADSDKSVLGHSKHFGIQDNALAYMGIRGTIQVYTLSGSTKTAVTANGLDASDAIENILEPNGGTVGFIDGVTFDTCPSFSNPIYIEMCFDNPIPLIERFMIQFNQYIARAFKILVKTTTSSSWTDQGISNATIYNNTSSAFSLLAHMVAANGEVKSWKNITDIRIEIYDALSYDNYNPDKKVGLSLIFANNAAKGGNSWLPRGGGEMYGTLDMGFNNISNVAAPSNGTDAVNRNYLQNYVNAHSGISTLTTDEVDSNTRTVAGAYIVKSYRPFEKLLKSVTITSESSEYTQVHENMTYGYNGLLIENGDGKTQTLICDSGGIYKRTMIVAANAGGYKRWKYFGGNLFDDFGQYRQYITIKVQEGIIPTSPYPITPFCYPVELELYDNAYIKIRTDASMAFEGSIVLSIKGDNVKISTDLEILGGIIPNMKKGGRYLVSYVDAGVVLSIREICTTYTVADTVIYDGSSN